MFSHAKSLKKVEALQKRALCFLYDECNSSLEEILKKSGKICMGVNRLSISVSKLIKVLTTLIPASRNKFFSQEKQTEQFETSAKLNLSVPKVNQVSYGEKSLRWA